MFLPHFFKTKKNVRGSSKVNEIGGQKRLGLCEGSDDTILNPKSQSPLKRAPVLVCFWKHLEEFVVLGFGGGFRGAGDAGSVVLQVVSHKSGSNPLVDVV